MCNRKYKCVIECIIEKKYLRQKKIDLQYEELYL